LMVEPGSVATEDGVIRIGVPYGSRARLILLYLQTEAIKTNSREIELGRSLREWLQKLGVSIGGKSMKDVREQALRLSRCRMTFQITKGNQIGFVNQNILDTALFTHHVNGGLLETVKLSEGFFEQL
ncbi:replication protein RepA, partial [Acetobacter pomorum]